MLNLKPSRQYRLWSNLVGGLRFWLIHVYFFSLLPTMPRLPHRHSQVVAKDSCLAKIFPKKHKWYHFYRYSPNIIRHLIDPLVSIWLLLLKPFAPYYIDRLKPYRKAVAIVCYLPIFIISLATHVGAKAILYWLLFPLSCPYYFYRNWDCFTSRQKSCAILLYFFVILAIATFFMAPYMHFLAGTFIAAYSLVTTSWFSATMSTLFTTMALWKSVLIVTITSSSLIGLIASMLANILYCDIQPTHPQLNNRDTSYHSDLSFLVTPSRRNKHNGAMPSRRSKHYSDNNSVASQLNEKTYKISNLLTPPTISQYKHYRYADGNTLDELMRKSVGKDKSLTIDYSDRIEKKVSYNETNDSFRDDPIESESEKLSDSYEIEHTLSHSIDNLLNSADNHYPGCQSQQITSAENIKTME